MVEGGPPEWPQHRVGGGPLPAPEEEEAVLHSPQLQTTTLVPQPRPHSTAANTPCPTGNIFLYRGKQCRNPFLLECN